MQGDGTNVQNGSERPTVDRRTFLEAGASAMGAGWGLAGIAPGTAASGAESGLSQSPIRVGVVGVGPRGQWHVRNLLANHSDVTVTAIADLHADRAAAAADLVRKARGTDPATYTHGEFDYRNLCERDDVDAVLIATPVYWLGRMTVDALRAGKHAAHEVAGAQTEEECWQMVDEKEKSGKRVMFLENCCYGQETMMITNMVEQGVFGEPYYAEGSYLHDCRPQFFDSSGKITWRGELWRDTYGSAYPQHGLGSNCKWLKINDGDRLESCQTMMTRPREARLHAAARFGESSGPAQVEFRTGDFVTSLIQTAQGRMIRIDYSLTCTRPYSRYYLLQGTQGCWDSRSGVFLGGGEHASGGQDGWQPLESYRDRYEHAYWRRDGEVAARFGGHGGIDYYCIYDFARMLREDKEPWIDVYDAAAWSAIIFCSKLSLDRGGARVDMPDFTRGRWKDASWRKGRIPIG
ncbi:MAG: hypothetical protein FJ297_07135 [Planctomycetes bacterium]|nr:hypothetical protein [Planctomycetota bacterium]